MENDYGAWLYTYWMCVLVSPSLYIWILPYPSLGGWLGWWAWLHNSSVILYPDWLVWTGWWAVLYYSTTNPGGVSWLVGWPGLVGVVKQLVTSSPSLIGWFGRAWWAVTNLRQSELGGTGLPLLCPWLGGMEMICLVSRWTLKNMWMRRVPDCRRWDYIANRLRWEEHGGSICAVRLKGHCGGGIVKAQGQYGSQVGRDFGGTCSCV